VPMTRGIIIAMALVGSIPLLSLATKIELTTYLGIGLVILTGSAGMAVVSKRFEAILGGVIIGALWPVVFETIKLAANSL